MGFGTLFLGYFLILNIAYHGLTDIISALIIMMALNKLSFVNGDFKRAYHLSAIFAVYGLGALVIEVMRMFSVIAVSESIITYMSIARNAIICLLTVIILRAIHSVTKEVDLPELSFKAKRNTILTYVLYSLWILLECLSLVPDLTSKALAFIAMLTLLLTIALVIMNLSLIYSCYMKICMPEDNAGGIKRSKYEFVNNYRQRQAEKQLEYEKYKLEKFENKVKKAKKKDKRK